MLKIYNTLSRKKDEFKPLKGNKVNLFVCGPTIYDYAHIGHAKTYISFDAFAKYLKQKDFNVFYLQNITDIDDKIINRAKEKNMPVKKLADEFEKEYLKDVKSIFITSVKKYEKATDNIKEIISQIKRMIESGFAYKASDGVYFDISKFKNYGKLSKRTALGAEDAVSRIDDSKNKRNKGDFCLWKLSKDSEPKWESPWGDGRPGWHIEDTAITEKFFGPQYDIHGGARDLIFPHHEAEIAEMESISGKSPLAKYWMHTGFLTVNGQKMSKSLNNFITIRDFISKNSPSLLRFMILKTLWHSPFDYSDKSLKESKAGLEKIEEFVRKISSVKNTSAKNGLISQAVKKATDDFYRQLDDDFNTPNALAVIYDFIKEMNKLFDDKKISKKNAKEILSFIKKFNEIFNILDFKGILKTPVSKEIKKLAAERKKARKENNWQKSDELRKQIEDKGYKIEDTQSGSVIRKI
ncbi:MAG: cysteine--tRNA ligase [Candidatus Nealsonbacteria bacterium]|nr:cysteine--tRNA ligase [Candidatus Nealsonbacteria bacterium]